jgi:hypothetical protein
MDDASVVFPSLAELACNKQWASLVNICRGKRVLNFNQPYAETYPSLFGQLVQPTLVGNQQQEIETQHKGYYAVEWAILHGELGIAQELLYWSKVCLDAALTVP